MTSVIDIVHHYQKSIEKANNDENRLLHCLNKLYKLPVTVQHLQETGIGRTVNSLRKFDGEVGAKSKALVTKWKEMVAAEESSENDAEESEKSDDDNINSEHDDVEMDTPDSSSENRKATIEIKIKKEIVESHRSLDTHNHQYDEERSSHRKEIKHKENIATDSEIHNDRDLNDNGYKLKHQHHSSSSKSSSHSKSHTSDAKSSNGHQGSSSSHSKDKTRDSEKYSHSSHKHEKSASHNSSSSKRKLEDALSDKLSDVEEHKYVIDDEKSKSTKKSKSDHKSSTSSSSNHHHSSRSSKHRDHSKSKDHSHSSSSNHKSKHVKIKKEDDENVKDKLDSNHHQNGENIIIKHSREGSPQQNDAKSGKEKKTKSAESETKTNDSNKTAKKRIHDSDDEKDGDGIDQSTGASFAEALGMLEPVSSKKTIKKKTQSPSQIKPEKPQFVTPSSNKSKPSATKPTSSKTTTPSVVSIPSTSSTPSLLAPSVKLKPLEAELSLDFVPTISNNYKPMPLNPIVMDCVFFNNKPQKKFMTDEEALGASISSKTMRTKVYSGTKSFITVVPPLLELCIRILQKNIDALEYTGGVPFDILKPILDRASAEQLFNFEHYNPYLMDDSDMLWQGHCNRRFKGKKRLEMETWREMFIRCSEEQESKLASLTENIKKTQVQSVPVKQTKLAYIDSTAKAPRNIRNKQIQFGTERKLITTPAARVASLSNVTSNIGQVGDTRLKVAAGSRDFAQVQGSGSKPRKAPLMAKAMQLMKGRFKR